MSIKRVGVLTGGGDVPGLNTAIKAIVRRAIDYGVEVVGLRNGWMGPMEIDPDDIASITKWTSPLGLESVRTIDRFGGTILHTSRVNPGNIQPNRVPAHVKPVDQVRTSEGNFDCSGHVVRVLDALNIDGLIPIGGDDTLSYAVQLIQAGVQVIGIPKTMDNDVFGTDYCIGFSTAVTRSVDFIRAFRTSCGSHERIGVVELFGRNSGETSLFAAYLADVDRAIISEVPFDTDRLIAFLVEDKAKNPSNYAITTISEGARPIGGEIIVSGKPDAYGHKKLGGIGLQLSEAIKSRTEHNTMYQQLAYLMRSGEPDSLDRMVAVSFGTLAMDQIAKGESGLMVALQDGKYTTVPLELVVAGKRTVDVAALYDELNYRPKVQDMLDKPMFLY